MLWSSVVEKRDTRSPGYKLWYIYKLGKKFMLNFISSRDGPVKVETRQGGKYQEDYATME